MCFEQKSLLFTPFSERERTKRVFPFIFAFVHLLKTIYCAVGDLLRAIGSYETLTSTLLKYVFPLFSTLCLCAMHKLS